VKQLNTGQRTHKTSEVIMKLIGAGTIDERNKECPVWCSYSFQTEFYQRSDGSRYSTSRYEFKFEILDNERGLYKLSFRDILTGGLISVNNSGGPEGLKSLENRLNSMLPERVTYHASFIRPRGIIKIKLKNKGV
jgi:hypothetical protein